MASLSGLFTSQFKSPDSYKPPLEQDPPSVYIQNESESRNMSGGSGDDFSEPFTLISSTVDNLGEAARDHAGSKGFLGHISSGKDWIASKHSKVKPWGEFFNPRSFSLPRGAGDVTSRLLGNLQRFQTNYLFVFLGLIVYCM